jgi:pectate lyase
MVHKLLSFSLLTLLVGLVIGAVLPQPVSAQSATPAFPTAEGFGGVTQGGRGGQVLFVTNLDDDGPGSFRAAVETTGPRIVVFKTGGTIDLQSTVKIANPYITIAGQTAPGDGISFKRSTLLIATHDVIIRGVRARTGDESGGTSPTSRDGINISSSTADTEVYNIILDHTSVAWGVDENYAIWKGSGRPDVHDITIQWSITGEALYDSIHLDEGASSPAPHSMGMLLGDKGASNMSIHHNLFAHNGDRNPRVNDVLNVEVTNNYMYGYGGGPAVVGSDPTTVQFIGNYFKPSADSIRYGREIRINDNLDAASQVYLEDNWTNDYDNDGTLYEAVVRAGSGFTSWPTPIISNSTVTVSPAAEVPSLLLGTVGSYIPVRDSVDDRLVDQANNRTGSIIDSQNEVGGWPNLDVGTAPADSDGDGMPDAWEVEYDLNENDASDAQNLSAAGYMMIEEYINSLYGEETIFPVGVDTCNIADIDRSGMVNVIDYSLLVADFFSSNPALPRADINQSGSVDILDYSLLAANFFETGECL